MTSVIYEFIHFFMNISVGIGIIVCLASHGRLREFPVSHKLGLWVGAAGMFLHGIELGFDMFAGIHIFGSWHLELFVEVGYWMIFALVAVAHKPIKSPAQA